MFLRRAGADRRHCPRPYAAPSLCNSLARCAVRRHFSTEGRGERRRRRGWRTRRWFWGRAETAKGSTRKRVSGGHGGFGCRHSSRRAGGQGQDRPGRFPRHPPRRPSRAHRTGHHRTIPLTTLRRPRAPAALLEPCSAAVAPPADPRTAGRGARRSAHGPSRITGGAAVGRAVGRRQGRRRAAVGAHSGGGGGGAGGNAGRPRGGDGGAPAGGGRAAQRDWVAGKGAPAVRARDCDLAGLGRRRRRSAQGAAAGGVSGGGGCGAGVAGQAGRCDGRERGGQSCCSAQGAARGTHLGGGGAGGRGRAGAGEC